jgi:periplasmic protein TonB
MAMARRVDDDVRLRWVATLVALAGHGAAIAVLSLMAISTPAAIPASVLSVSWIGEEAPAPAPPEPVIAKPLPTKPKMQARPSAEPVPVAAVAPASVPAAPVPATEPAASAPVAVATPASAPPQPMPVVAPRFDAAYLSNPAPIYPAASRNLGEQGKVFLSVLVTPQGEAQEVRLRTGSGFERLDLAAQEAVRRWKFLPARQGEEAVAAWVVVPVLFSLRRQS